MKNKALRAIQREWMENIVNQPGLEDLKCTPEEIEQLKDKDNEIDMESFYKYSLGKCGFSKKEQNCFAKNLMNYCNNPKIIEV